MSLAAASRYAKALLDIAADPASQLQPAVALGQLEAFEGLLNESELLRQILVSPAVAVGKKRAAAGRLAEQLGVHRLVRSFLYVLIDHRRTPLFAMIRKAFEAQLDEMQGVVRADVTASQALEGPQREAIERKLAQVSGRSVRCDYAVDAALIGGVSVKIGSTVYDGSVRGQLDLLRRRLASGA